MYTLNVIFSNNETFCHKFNSFQRARRKLVSYLRAFDCVCFLSFFDTTQKVYVVQRFTNSKKDVQIELHY